MLRHQFIPTITWSLYLRLWATTESTIMKKYIYNAGDLVAMQIRRCDAWRIAQWGTSWASLEATGCRHRASACTTLLPRPPWSTNSLQNTKHQQKTIFSSPTYGLLQTKAKSHGDVVPQNGPSTQLIDATSCVEKGDTTIGAEGLRATFLSIKHCQRTKVGKVFNSHETRYKKGFTYIMHPYPQGLNCLKLSILR